MQHNKILIVEIDSTLSYYEKIKNEILGDEFFYYQLGIAGDFNKIPAADKKIAVLSANYVTNCFEKIPPINLSMFDLVIVFDQELLPEDNIEQYLIISRIQFSNENVIIITGAIKQNLTLTSDKIFIFPLFFLDAVYEYNTNTFRKLKPKLFDVLLGIRKDHRIWIFNALTKNNLIDKSYVSLTEFQNSSLETIYYSPDLHELENATAKLSMRRYGTFFSHEALLCHPRLPFIKYPISRQLPEKIYQNSYYSIIAETNYHSYIFFTEKTVKPLLAKRLFVMFSTYHHLKKLHEYGFKTFGSIIDESYDDEVNDYLRFEKAFEQIIKLSKMDPIEVYEKIGDVLEHNYKLITNRELLMLPLKNYILSHINRI